MVQETHYAAKDYKLLQFHPKVSTLENASAKPFVFFAMCVLSRQSIKTTFRDSVRIFATRETDASVRNACVGYELVGVAFTWRCDLSESIQKT